jgi:hypothetical protein
LNEALEWAVSCFSYIKPLTERFLSGLLLMPVKNDYLSLLKLVLDEILGFMGRFSWLLLIEVLLNYNCCCISLGRSYFLLSFNVY